MMEEIALLAEPLGLLGYGEYSLIAHDTKPWHIQRITSIPEAITLSSLVL
jgi:hypothetical protein